MPQALRISSEMLICDLLGSSPGFSSGFCAGAGGGLGAADAVGAAGAGGGSEAQPAAMAVEKRTIAAAYFMTSSLKARPLLGAGPGIPRLPLQPCRRALPARAFAT